MALTRRLMADYTSRSLADIAYKPRPVARKADWKLTLLCSLYAHILWCTSQPLTPNKEHMAPPPHIITLNWACYQRGLFKVVELPFSESCQGLDTGTNIACTTGRVFSDEFTSSPTLALIYTLKEAKLMATTQESPTPLRYTSSVYLHMLLFSQLCVPPGTVLKNATYKLASRVPTASRDKNSNWVERLRKSWALRYHGPVCFHAHSGMPHVQQYLVTVFPKGKHFIVHLSTYL
jgi:hypothetical protein